MHSFIPVICKKHGQFSIRAYSLLQGIGCKKCANEHKKLLAAKDKSDFVKEARAVHEDKYDYSKFHYVNTSTKGIIICSVHGEFLQTPHHHIRLKQGCPECGKVKCAQSRRLTTQWFRKTADIAHPENDHSESEYIDTHTPLSVRCPLHGVFQIRPCDYLNLMQGCPKCGHLKAGQSLKMPQEEFIALAASMPEHKQISYDKVIYVSGLSPVILTCKDHGEFRQTPLAHLAGQSCPDCYHPASKWENEIAAYIQNAGFNIVQSYREWHQRQEIDIYIPERRLGFECNGLFYHHSGTGGKPRLYHRDKSAAALKAGISLVHLWDANSLEMNKSMVASKLGVVQKIPARKTVFKEISAQSANSFCMQNHLQGSAGKTTIWAGGLFYNDGGNDALTAVMTPRRFGGQVELSRFATLLFTQVIGGFSKLLEHSILWAKQNGCIKIISFANRDITPDPDKSVYSKTGFVLQDTPEDPILRYCNPKKSIMYNRQRFMKNRQRLLWPDITEDDIALKTETQICEQHGIYPVYGTGRWKFELDLSGIIFSI
jgi:hypothetical protein